MARARNIKPQLFDNEVLAELDPFARLLFIGLWCWADREGRLEDRPKRIHKEILGYDSCDCDRLLNDLHRTGFITRYSVGGEKYIQITKFTKHQNPHHQEKESVIPEFILDKSEITPRQDEIITEPIVLIPDSLILIPDSLNQIPDTVEQGGKPPKVVSAEAQEIIDYLNLILGTNYKSTTKATQDLIKARLKEKYTVDDFKRVIDIKYAEWSGDPKTSVWLRPSTLFGNKFESYLNQKPPDKYSTLPKNLQDAFRLAEEEKNKPKELTIFDQG